MNCLWRYLSFTATTILVVLTLTLTPEALLHAAPIVPVMGARGEPDPGHTAQEEYETHERSLLSKGDLLLGGQDLREVDLIDGEYRSLFKEFMSYEKDVSMLRVVIANDKRPINPDVVNAIEGHVANQLDLIRTSLRDIQVQVSSHREDVNRRVTLFVSRVGVLVALVSLTLVLFQIYLMKRQDKMMAVQSNIAGEQLVISKRQDEIYRELLFRKPSLELLVNKRPVSQITFSSLAPGEPVPCNLPLSIRNSGDKTVRDFYFHVAAPVTLELSNEPTGEIVESHRLEIGREQYIDYRVYKMAPIYPTRAVDIGMLPFRGQPGDYKVFWYIVTEDGVFPSNERHGELIVKAIDSASDVEKDLL